MFTAAGNTAIDAVVLAFGIPLVVRAWLDHRAGSPPGNLLLVGSLGYLLYVYANYALGVAFNPLYLAYVTLLSASLFGFLAAGKRSVPGPALDALPAGPPPAGARWWRASSAASWSPWRRSP